MSTILAADADLLRMEAGDGYWYLGTAYTRYPGGLDAAYVIACRAVARLWDQGVPCLSPIAMTHGAGTVAGLDLEDPEFWKWVDEPFVWAAMGLIVLHMDGWRKSAGLAHEIRAFQGAGKPIVHMRWPGLEVLTEDNV